MITRSDVEDDIQKYRKRLAGLRSKLFELQDPKLSAAKKRRQRKKIESEIKHVRGLISMAYKALNDWE
jgi:hypothetical protein